MTKKHRKPSKKAGRKIEDLPVDPKGKKGSVVAGFVTLNFQKVEVDQVNAESLGARVDAKHLS